MLRALVDAGKEFPDLCPHGYDAGEIRWVLEINPRDHTASLVRFEKGQLKKYLPVRGDRSGKVSEDNLKPALLADKAAYALGMRADRSLDPDCIEHRSFRKRIEELDAEWPESEPSRILSFLSNLDSDSGSTIRDLRKRMTAEMKPSEMIAFRSEAAGFPFESPSAQSYWYRFLESEYRLKQEAQCSCCGVLRPVLRILPSQVSFAGYSCPIASFNARAFDSYGHDQTANSPLCFSCASEASRLLQHLLNSERHHRVLTRDESRGTGRTPLRNEWAVFWLKKPVTPVDGEEPFDFERP